MPRPEKLQILYEHPHWFRPLFAELDRRGLPWEPVQIAGHTFDPGEEAPLDGTLLFNRMSPSAWLRGLGSAIPYTTHLLDRLESTPSAPRIINGARAWATEISKASQLGLLSRLGLPFPAARVIHDPASAPRAAAGLRFPVVVKPNVGGSGAGVRRFEASEALEAAAHAGELDLGLDGTGLVQEYIPAEEGRIVRVETLGGRFLYAIAIYSSGDDFNLCPADVCRSRGGAELQRSACALDAPSNDLSVEAFTPPPAVIEAVERMTREAGIEIGGVEYLVDSRDGSLHYYDINALSNFVADGPTVLGFDPFERLGDWLEQELKGSSANARRRAS